MIEKIILDYLNDKLDVDVYLERPVKAPLKYVLLEKTGSSRENYINSATAVLSSKLNSDYNFTDTTKKSYRYQAIYDLVF